MGSGSADEKLAILAYNCGKEIAARGCHLLCGGMSGVMQHAARGAKESGGLTIGILPGRNRDESAPNEYIDIPIFSGMRDARNFINVCSADAILALPGGPGTLSEIALALKVGKAVACLTMWKDAIEHENLHYFEDVNAALDWLVAAGGLGA